MLAGNLVVNILIDCFHHGISVGCLVCHGLNHDDGAGWYGLAMAIGFSFVVMGWK